MTAEVFFLFSGLSFQALADLRWQSAPAAMLFCVGGVAIGFHQDPVRIVAALLLLLWGLGLGTQWAAYLFLLHPTTLLLMPWGHAARKAKIGLDDLLVLTGLGAALSWPALLLAILGIEAWRNWWRWRWPAEKRFPMMPGVAFGCCVYLIVIV